jgi:replicative DNA helicase
MKERTLPEGTKIPPHDLRIEETILGQLMIEVNKNTINAISIINEDDFYKESHKLIYRTISLLYKRDNVCNFIIVCHELMKIQALEIVGGSYIISTLSSNVSSTLNVIYHARILKQLSIARKLIAISYNVQTSVYEMKDVKEIIDTLNKDINNIYKDVDKEDSIVLASKVSDELMKDLLNDNFVLNKKNTGFKILDKIIGITLNKILLVAGPAKHGKSKFISMIMMNILEKYSDVSIFWITLEDSAKDIIAGYIASKILITPKDIIERTYSKDCNSIIKPHIEKFKTFDIEFQEKSAKVSQFGIKFIEFCKMRKGRFNILIIDNMLSLSDKDDFKGNDNGMYDYIMLQLLNIKQRTNALIIPIHHYRDAQQAEGKIESAYRPRLIDMKGTEAFRRVPNQVLLLNNPGKYKDLVIEYKGHKDLLKSIFICDTGANRNASDDDDSALIRFFHTLEFNIFEEIN